MLDTELSPPPQAAALGCPQGGEDTQPSPVPARGCMTRGGEPGARSRWVQLTQRRREASPTLQGLTTARQPGEGTGIPVPPAARRLWGLEAATTAGRLSRSPGVVRLRCKPRLVPGLGQDGPRLPRPQRNPRLPARGHLGCVRPLPSRGSRRSAHRLCPQSHPGAKPAPSGAVPEQSCTKELGNPHPILSPPSLHQRPQPTAAPGAAGALGPQR